MSNNTSHMFYWKNNNKNNNRKKTKTKTKTESFFEKSLCL